MKLLLDTHTLIWAVDQPNQLGAAATTALQDPANDLLLSAASIWEIAIKVGLEKLTLSLPYRQWIAKAMDDLGLAVLPIIVDYTDELIKLAPHHRDPFDRLLAAQAIVENVSLVTIDAIFNQYGVRRIWD